MELNVTIPTKGHEQHLVYGKFSIDRRLVSFESSPHPESYTSWLIHISEVNTVICIDS